MLETRNILQTGDCLVPIVGCVHVHVHLSTVQCILNVIQGGPQLKILACCMAKNLDIVCECMCAKYEDPCGWGPRPALKGP